MRDLFPNSSRSCFGGSSARKGLTRKTSTHKKAQDFSWALMAVFWFTGFRNLHKHGGIHRTLEDVLSR